MGHYYLKKKKKNPNKTANIASDFISQLKMVTVASPLTQNLL